MLPGFVQSWLKKAVVSESVVIFGTVFVCLFRGSLGSVCTVFESSEVYSRSHLKLRLVVPLERL